MTLPAWLSGYAGVDDDALVVLGNRGLLRRAERELATAELVAASEAEITVTVGTATVRLLPGGPGQARCPCPVAGVCVHVITACLWARQHGSASEVDVLAEVLNWDPVAINRAAGIAAVRRARGLAPAELDARSEPNRLTLSWPGSPQVMVLAEGDFAAMLVAGEHSAVALNAWKLAALAGLFAAHGQEWSWPAEGPDELPAVRRQAAAAVVAATEGLLRPGLSQVRTAEATRLEAAGNAAKLAKLPLLASLTATAAATAIDLAQRDDATSEDRVLSDTAQAWGLATALSAAEPAAPQLVGEHSSSTTELGMLMPLSAVWWQNPSGSRGVTMQLWHAAKAQVLTATDGRAANAGRDFVKDWNSPLLWGASMAALCAGPFRLAGAELRPDGSLSPTRRTTLAERGSFEGVDVPALAIAVNSLAPAPVRFGRSRSRLRLILPRRRHGAAPLELDEVHQQVVWEVIDVDGEHHRLEFSVFDTGLSTLSWIIAQKLPIVALVVVGNQLESVFVEAEPLRLIPLTLDTNRPWRLERRLKKRLDQLRQQRRAAPATSDDPLTSTLNAVGELLADLASSTAPASPRQVESLRRRSRELAAVGLDSLSRALLNLGAEPTPRALLQARFLLDRVVAIRR